MAVTNDFSAMPFFFAQVANKLSCVRTVTHHSLGLRCTLLLSGSLLFAPMTSTLAADGGIQVQNQSLSVASSVVQVQCLPNGGAFLRARLTGAIDKELSWTDRELSCAGSVRPNAGGIRLRFTSTSSDNEPRLVLLFGITGLKEGESGKALPVNLTVMREGTGEFYGTQGDNKCTADDIRQEPLSGIPLRQRVYRITARGFCTQPARALNGTGLILITRFDFVGRADFESDDAPDTTALIP